MLLVVTPWFHMSDLPKLRASHQCVSVGSPISETNQFGSPFTRPGKLTKNYWENHYAMNGKTHYFDWAMASIANS